jgi:hypothetical protein
MAMPTEARLMEPIQPLKIGFPVVEKDRASSRCSVRTAVFSCRFGPDPALNPALNAILGRGQIAHLRKILIF